MNKPLKTAVASFIDADAAAGPATRFRTAANRAKNAKTIIHPSIYEFSVKGRTKLVRNWPCMVFIARKMPM
jgi:hypothetical protein